MLGWLFFGQRQPQYDLEALRAYYLTRECDLWQALPSEDDFTAWLEALEPEDIDSCEELGRYTLDGGEDTSEDFWDFVGAPEARGAWHTYQRGAQTWGLLSNAARVYAWLHGWWW